MITNIINVALIIAGVLVMALFILLVLLLLAVAAHQLIEHSQRKAAHKRALAQGYGYILNGQFYTPDELVAKAELQNDALTDHINRLKIVAALKHFKSEGIVVDRAGGNSDLP